MKKIILRLSTLAILLICNHSSNAQWVQTNGPYAGNVNSLATDGTNFFVGTDFGIYLSTDSGMSWKFVSQSLPQLYVTSIVINGSHIFAGDVGYGVHESTDNGNTWIAKNNGLANRYVESLAMSGSNLFAGTDGGVFLSTNNANSWVAMNNALTDSFINTIAINDTTVFAGTDQGIFLSTDTCKNWKECFPTCQIYSLAFSNGDIFTAAWGCGVNLSTDNGTNWASSDSGITTPYIQSVAASGSNVFAGTDRGIFLSIDNSRSWKEVNNILLANSIFINGNNIWAATLGTGVMLSKDNGNNWNPSNNGLIGSYINALAVSGNNLLAATQYGGIFSSSDGGNTWTPSSSGLNSYLCLSLAVSGNNIFAGTGNGVSLSADGGSSWKAVNNGLPPYSYIYSIGISGNNIFAGSYNQVFLSTDTGKSWTSVSNGLNSTYYQTFLCNGSNIFVGAHTGLFLSTNNGSSWTEVINNIPVLSLAMSGNNIFAATGGFPPIYLSADTGKTWIPVDSGITDSDILSLISDGVNIFAGSGFGGVFLSTNNGNNWTIVKDPFTTTDGIGVSSFVINGSNIFLGTEGTGVWKRTLSEMVGVVEINNDNNGLNIYPNPATNQLIIHTSSFHNEAVTVSIMNMLGQAASPPAPFQRRGEDAVIDISKLSSGMYFLQLRSESGSVTKKFVKEN